MAFSGSSGEGQSQEGTKTNSLCKDNHFYRFLVQQDIPKPDKVFSVLTKSVDITKKEDLISLEESDIKDICNQFNLSILVRRKLLNARKELLKIPTSNLNPASQSAGVIIIRVSDKETQLEKNVTTISNEIESYITAIEKSLLEAEKEEKETVSMIDEKISLIINELNKYKKKVINDVNNKYNKKTNELKILMENGINLKEETTRVRKHYKNMFNPKTNVNNNSTDEAICDSQQREEYLLKNYNKMVKEFETIKNSDMISYSKKHCYTCEYNEKIGKNFINTQLPNLFLIEACSSSNSVNDTFMTLDGTIKGIKFDYNHKQMQNHYHVIGNKLIQRKNYLKQTWEIKTSETFEGTIGVLDETNGQWKELIKNGQHSCNHQKCVVAGSVSCSFCGSSFGEHKVELSSKIQPSGITKLIIDFGNNTITFNFMNKNKQSIYSYVVEIQASMTCFRLVTDFAYKNSSIEIL